MIRYWAHEILVIMLVLLVLVLISLSILTTFPGRIKDLRVGSGTGTYVEER
jgi:hypothetical protein